DVRQGTWKADFDIWFRWFDPQVDPGERFQLVNGEIEHRDKLVQRMDGNEHYARYRVAAQLPKYFDPSRFPFGDEELSIDIEDGAKQIRWFADEGSGLSRRAFPRSIDVEQSSARVTDSTFVFTMLGKAPAWAQHLKNFQALYASILI